MKDVETIPESGTPPSGPPAHPDEINSTFDMSVGRHVTLHARASVTPVGVVAAGIAVALMTLAAGYAVGAMWRRRRD